ncbi:HAMP domain-containing sensor histidine kinase [Solirubrobacter soli]|uniref:HAMP domain-containing sensor histidine kinase n=1 Tax=Solirubrobacter soli TaxID=363832 RepID=UPI0004202766|nr:HAMP domain-containing sensor histidine kinase [Solirubrobacter soli]
MRRRLIATTALIALVATLVLGIPLGLVESSRARGDALSRLEREADDIAAAVDDRAAKGLTAAALAPWLRAGHAADVVSGTTRIRVGRIPVGGVLSARSGATQGVRVTVYASAAEVTRRRRQIWLLVGGLALAGTAAAVALAVLQARRFTRPLDRLVATSGRLGQGDFSARTGHLDLPEFDRVATALDAAAVQIAQLVGRQREFTANVSHQLRTPLTAMRLRLDELSTLQDPAAARDELDATLRVADRLERTVTELLALARAGDIGRPTDVDLASVARDHTATWKPVYARAGRTLVLEATVPLPARVSPGGVAQALDVLLENALHHGSGTTRLQATVTNGRNVLTIEDEGAGVPVALETAIFERNVSTAGSTGLGLSLARALVEADGGRLILVRPRPARFEIILPPRS